MRGSCLPLVSMHETLTDGPFHIAVIAGSAIAHGQAATGGPAQPPSSEGAFAVDCGDITAFSGSGLCDTRRDQHNQQTQWLDGGLATDTRRDCGWCP